MLSKQFENYINKEYIQRLAIVKDENEHSGRTFLENLLNTITEEHQLNNIHIVHEGKRNQDGLGAPDFVIKNLTNYSILGFIETKKIGTNLDEVYKSSQIQKYIKLTDNLILTDYLEFIWIYKGVITKRERICYLRDLDNKKTKLNLQYIENVQHLLIDFLREQAQEITKVKDLAQKLARPSIEIKEYLEIQIKLQSDGTIAKGKLFGLYNVFKQSLFEELTINQFADSFAQMLTYAMFLAKINTTSKLTLQNAKDHIPLTFNLIKTLVEFLDLLNNNEHKEIQYAVEIVLSVINNMNSEAIASELHFKYNTINKDTTNEKDPYIYFYEDFLKEYDVDLRIDRGVYYTPLPIVEFIVREVSNILETEFSLKEGIANQQVKLLDFACGTGTFLLEVFRTILLKTNTLNNNIIASNTVSNKFINVVENHILNNIYGFELLISAYIISHLKLSQFLKEQGYDIINNQKRLGVYLTNTLENKQNIQIDYLLPALGEEGAAAQKIKENKDIIVILGNPPYNSKSQNNSVYIKDLIKPYFPNDTIKERNPKGLNDDYVKFIRFAENKIANAGSGIVAVITSHSFLDNPTFRQMRKHLMTTFNKIYTIDLHGNTKKKEKTPNGDIDKNVFDIQQGVAITFFIKNGSEKAIYHHDIWGKREEKFKQLSELDLVKSVFNTMTPSLPFNLFVPQNENLREDYEQGISLRDIFLNINVGICTSKDEKVISFNNAELKDKIIRHFSDYNEIFVKNINYRPFDVRKIYYNTETKGIIERARVDIMQHFISNVNIGLISQRSSVTNNKIANTPFISNILIDQGLVFPSNKGISTIAPLYLYPKTLNHEEKRVNFKQTFIDEIINKQYSAITPTPEQILSYIYAVLHSPTYRTKYLDFLKIDFPRIHFCDDTNKFLELAKLGQELINVHLMKNIPNTLNVDCFIDKTLNNLTVEKLTFNEKQQTLHFNKLCYFTGIAKSVWEFKIGGYQVIDKYLKSRKGRVLTTEEITHITNIIKVLDFTITQMQKIDDIYNS